MSDINLAPLHKTGLTLPNPLTPAAGCSGLGSEYQSLLDANTLSAIVVGPVTTRPRPGAAPPRAIPVPRGLLLHTGLASPGVNAILRDYAQVWRHLSVPTSVHLAGTHPAAVQSCCQRFASVDNVGGIELVLPADVTEDEADDLVHSAARVALPAPPRATAPGQRPRSLQDSCRCRRLCADCRCSASSDHLGMPTTSAS